MVKRNHRYLRTAHKSRRLDTDRNDIAIKLSAVNNISHQTSKLIPVIQYAFRCLFTSVFT